MSVPGVTPPEPQSPQNNPAAAPSYGAQPQYPQPDHQQAQYPQPGYEQAGYEQPGYQQPGYQYPQPGYEQPAPPYPGQAPYPAPYGADPYGAPYGVRYASGKNLLVATLLCFFLGVFGIHRFYVGKVGTGIAQLLTAGGLGIWTLIDFIMLVCQAFKDSDGYTLRWDTVH